MNRKNSKSIIVDSDLGKKNVDYIGAAISGVRMDAFTAYEKIPNLLQKFINDNDKSAWEKIKNKIDYIYCNIGYTLEELDKETDFGKKIKFQTMSGKKLLFKPNLVAPKVIDNITHGEGEGAAICTEWPLIAALMRWFHDKLDISYSQIAIGEASTSTFILSYMFSKAAGKNITTEAVIEGKSGNFYGGWGFYFVRKYLSENLSDCNRDNPMNGYEESITGKYLPPGRAGNRLMVYDLNKVQNDVNKGRTVPVPNGVNFSKITLHKAIIGGNSSDEDDLRDYPGCILVNVPKLKMHAQDLLTNSIKNLGIGLYPGQCSKDNNPNETSWKYAYPSTPNPSLKGKLPHSPWVLEMDEHTMLPVKDSNGEYIAKKTGGFSGTQADVIRAVQNQNIFMLHIVDAVNMINISHDPDGNAVRVPEGYVFSSLDCVALDLFCARYCFKTVSMLKALKLKQKNKWSTEFVHHVPVAKIEGKNILTETDYDSPLFRYHLYDDAEERGVGQQKYYVVGWDSVTETPLVSLQGHFGRIDNAEFIELMTETMYYNPTTFIHDLQKTALSYAKACDTLTDSSIFKEIMDNFDENNDSIINYDEKGRGIETAQFCILAHAIDIQITAAYGIFKSNFMIPAYLMKNSNKNWNIGKHDFSKELFIVKKVVLAYEMSKSEVMNKDFFYPEMTYGKGMWPSWQTVTYILITNSIYGSQSSKYISMLSLYGSVFQYADKILNVGAYTGSINQNISDSDSINKYFEAVSKGSDLLKFTLYVPMGYQSLMAVKIPNVKGTEDPEKIFTAHFNEIW